MALGSSTELPTSLQNLGVLDIHKTQLSQDLRHKRSFYTGTQHDHLPVTWAGACRQSGTSYMQERLSQMGFQPINGDNRPALWLRRPDCQVPIGVQIVEGFTGMLLAEAPNLHVFGDDDTGQYLKAIFEQSKAWEVFAQARSLAGSQGAAAILAGIHNNAPFTEPLDPANLWVAEWDERSAGWRPKVVVEQVRVARETRDKDTGKLKTKEFWQVRAWTDEASFSFHDELCDEFADNGVFRVREAIPHKLGRCPIVWYQNYYNAMSPYAVPDYHGVYERMDQLDRLESQVHKATADNADPTVVVREDRRQRGERVLRRGGVFGVEAHGDVKYLEISGAGIAAAQSQVDRDIAVIRDTAQCVIITPGEGTRLQSSESLQMLYRPMESKAGRLKVGLAAAIMDLSDLWVRLARNYPIEVEVLGDPESHKKPCIILPPRKRTDSGKDSGKDEERPEPHRLGTGGTLQIGWAPAFRATPAQIAALSASLSTATAAKQFLSKQTATRTLAQHLAVDGEEELKRVKTEQDEEAALFDETMTEGLGGSELPPGYDAQLPEGSPGNARDGDDIQRPAATAKRGKRGPEVE